jgi:hypothetical protein
MVSAERSANTMQTSTPRSTRRTYTINDYRRDLARIAELRATGAPGLNTLLASRLIEDAIPESTPPESGVVMRRPTLIGVAPPAAAAPPVTPAVLRAMGLSSRPSARGGAR